MAGFWCWREEISKLQFIGEQSNRAKTSSCIIVRDKETRLFLRRREKDEPRMDPPSQGLRRDKLRIGNANGREAETVTKVDLVDLVDWSGRSGLIGWSVRGANREVIIFLGL